MNKENFIKQLQEIPGNPIIETWDPDINEWMPVTGFTYDPDVVRLYTDRDDDFEVTTEV